jgi:phosphonate transport system substrate-binding protein
MILRHNSIQKKILFGLIQFFILMILLSCTINSSREKIIFGIVPADDAEEMLSIYRPVASYLEEVLGVEVELIALSDYTAAVEAMRAGRIEIAWFGPFSYILAAERAGAEAIVVGVREETGFSSYRTVFITHSDNMVFSINDLKGKSFAFVDPASTSGNLIPRSILLNMGINPETFFSNQYFAGTHNSVVFSVKNKTVSAGVTSDNVVKRMIEENIILPGELRVIYVSDPIPGSPIAVRGNLDNDFKYLIQSAFINMPLEIAAGWGGVAYYEAISDENYDIIRSIARTLNLFD